MRYRLDELLVLKKLVSTRSQSKLLIKEGSVIVDEKIQSKPSQQFSLECKIEITTEENYVGRGAKKMKAAIETFKIEAANKIIADVGASTGGFTDYLLQNGAQKIFAIDVGKDQLAEKLRNDSRVINMEGINIKNPLTLPEKVDFAVTDLSYISLTLALKNIGTLLKKNGFIIALFKPQFEAGPKVVGKDGVLKDPEIIKQLLQEFQIWCSKNGFKVKQTIPSPITGKVGNQEYLCLIEQAIDPKVVY